MANGKNKFFNRGEWTMKTTIGFSCAVNHDLTVAKMITAGKYDFVVGDIPRWFSKSGHGLVEVTFELVHLNLNIAFDEAVRELNKRDLRPADFTELLAFGAAFPEEQRKYPIVELGSAAWVYGANSVVSLYSSENTERYIHIVHWTGNLSSCRILAVRK